MAGKGSKVLIAAGNIAGDEARREDWQGQARRRAVMYALADSTWADDAGKARDLVKRSSQSVARSADPLKLKLTGKGSEKSRRKLAEKSEGLQRGKRTWSVLNARQLQAARLVRDTVLVLTGGMKAQDFTRERVDTSGAAFAGNSDMTGVLYADYRLRSWFNQAKFGMTQIEVVMRIAGMEESISAVALDMETDAKARSNGGFSRETQAYVKRLFVEAMDDLADVVVPRTNRCTKNAAPMSQAIRSWSKEGGVFSLEFTAFGEREDLVRKSR